MTYTEVAGIISTDGVKEDLPGYIYSWNIENQRLYVWFQKIINPQSVLYGELMCYHFELRDNLELQKGQTYDEVLNLLRAHGTLVANADNMYFWDTEDEHKYFVFFEEDADGVLKVSNFGNDCDIRTLASSTSYEAVCALFQSEGTKRSIENQVYSWSFLGGNIFAEFDFTENEQLLLKQYVFFSTTDFVDLSYDEVCNVIGSTGELYEHEYAKDTIYRWESGLDADLFVIFNDEMIAERFGYETDIKTEVGSSLEMFKFVFGEKKYSSYSTKHPILPAPGLKDDTYSYTWETKGEFDIQAIISYDTRKVTDILYNIPRLDLNNEMTDRELRELLGDDYYVRNYPNLPYVYWCWHYGEYDLCADFTTGRGLAWTLYFKECEGHEEAE